MYIGQFKKWKSLACRKLLCVSMKKYFKGIIQYLEIVVLSCLGPYLYELQFPSYFYVVFLFYIWIQNNSTF